MVSSINESPSDTDCNKIYLRNMRLLWRWDPELAVRVDAVADEARTKVEPARNGGFTAALPTVDGGQIYLHSRYNPMADGEKMVANVDVEEHCCFIVGGLGLGYHLLALHAKAASEILIVVCEPSVELIAATLATVDLTALLADAKLVFLTDDDKARLHERLKPHTAFMMLGSKFVPHPPSQRIAPEFHSLMRAVVTDFVAYSRMSVLTLLANAEITCRNIAHNVADYVSTPGINVLRQRFLKNPAVVVSAGPSLRKNIDQLAGLKGRAVICATQTTLKPLLERGIVPDLVTSLDYHQMSGQYFEGVDGLEQVHLVAEPKASWHVLDNHKGPVSLLDNDFARLLIGDDLAPKDGLRAGATVAHLAFYLAVYMGCDPIIFVGQDLAYTGHVYYVPGVEIHRTWRPEMNRFNTLEMREWERIVRGRSILRKVQDNEGRELYTDELLFTYLEQFEKDFGGTAARVINATEGGARIRHTEVMTLAEAAQRYCREPIPPERFAYRDRYNWYDSGRLVEAQSRLKKRLDEIEDVERVCVEMLGLLKKLKGLTDRPDDFNKTLVRVDELRARVHRSKEAFQIINTGSQVAELRRFSADRKLMRNDMGELERAKKQIARDMDFVTGIRDGARTMIEILTKSLERIDQAIARGGRR